MSWTKLFVGHVSAGKAAENVKQGSLSSGRPHATVSPEAGEDGQEANAKFVAAAVAAAANLEQRSNCA